MIQLSEKRFLVTGSASGIGLQITDVLANAGARVLATDIAEERLNACAQQHLWSDNAILRRHDVSDPDSWRAALDAAEEAFGGLDVVLNVAGYLNPGYVYELDPQDVDRHFDINTKGVIYGTSLASERMAAQGSGHIINIASMAAMAPVPGIALYSASKYAVRAFSIAAASELRDKGVSISVVCPDPVDTPMLDAQKHRAEAAITFSAPRVLSVEEVAAVILGPVLADRPLEVALPLSRKWLARVADLWPSVGMRFVPLFRSQGRKRQRSM